MSTLRIRPFELGDAEAVARLARRCLLEVNGRDYPPPVIESLCALNTARAFVERSARRRVFVAVARDADARVVGTVSLEGNGVFSLFVDPDAHGLGVGRSLMGHVEALAEADGHGCVELESSVTARRFYLGLGYVELEARDGDLGLVVGMRKSLG